MKTYRRYFVALLACASVPFCRDAAALNTEVTLESADNRKAVVTVKVHDILPNCRKLQLVGLTRGTSSRGRLASTVREIRTIDVPVGSTKATILFS